MTTSGAPAFGLTQTQSMPGGGGIVPLVSIAISKPRACNAAISGGSSCNSGSPPVQTTKRGRRSFRPQRRDPVGERVGIAVAAALGAVHADKIGVAECADRVGPVLLAPGPQIAAGKPAEHRRPPGQRPLALQRVEDFLDGVGHAPPTKTSHPRRRKSQAGQAPQP